MKYKLLGVLISVAVFAITALPTFADGPNVPQPRSKPSAAEMARTRQKEIQTHHMLQMVDRYLEGKTSYAALEAVVQAYNDHWAKGIPARQTIERLTAVDPNLGLTLVAQETSYWCGPASAYMVLAYKGAWTDPSDPNRSLSQLHLSEDLGTTESGTDLNNVPGVLNHWTSTGYYINSWSPSTSDVLDYTRTDYANNYPLIYDAHMSDQNGYLEGYSEEIWHYVAGDGYDLTDQTVHYYDPNGRNQAAYGDHWIPASTMSGVMSDLGMTW